MDENGASSIQNHDRHNINNRAKQQFYQSPKLLLLGSFYKDSLNANARQAYSVLLDRLSVSIKNGMVDEHGDIYFLYSVTSLSKILNVSKDTVRNVKKQLMEVSLLEEVEIEGKASRLYLSEPAPANDEEAKYILLYNDDLEDQEGVPEKRKDKISRGMIGNKNAKKTDGVEKTDTSMKKPSNQQSEENKKQMGSKKPTGGVEKVDTSKNNLVRTKELKDSKEGKDHKTDENNLFQNSICSGKENEEIENEIIDSYIEMESLDRIYGEQIIRIMKKFSFGSFETFKLYSDKLVFADLSAEKELGYTINSSDDSHMQMMLFKTFNLILIKERKGEVKSFSDYLFTAFKNLFIEYGLNNPPVDINRQGIDSYEDKSGM